MAHIGHHKEKSNFNREPKWEFSFPRKKTISKTKLIDDLVKKYSFDIHEIKHGGRPTDFIEKLLNICGKYYYWQDDPWLHIEIDEKVKDEYAFKATSNLDNIVWIEYQNTNYVSIWIE